MDNMTALHFAAQNGHAELCRMLIIAGTPVSIKNTKGITAPHFARVEGALHNSLFACSVLIATISSHQSGQDLPNNPTFNPASIQATQ